MIVRFNELMHRLHKFDELIFPGPAGEKEVQMAEAELGTAFPASYKWFLANFGAAGFPLEIYGVEPSVKLNATATFWNVVYMTESERNEAEPRMPNYLVPFNPDGMGNHLCLNTAMMKNGECPVVLWDHDSPEQQHLKIMYNTFLDWLEKRLTFEEEYYNKK